MITIESYLWYIKATHLMIPLLIALGIFLRWKVVSNSLRPLAILFLITAIFYAFDLYFSSSYELHPFQLKSGVGLAYSFGSLYHGMSIATFAYIYAHAIFKPVKNNFKIILTANFIPITSFLFFLIFIALGFSPIPNNSFDGVIANLGVDPFAMLWLVSMICFEIFAVYISLVALRWMVIHRRNIKNNVSQLGSFRYYYVYFTYLSFSLSIPLGIWLFCAENTASVKIISSLSFTVIIVLIYIFATLQQDIYSEANPMIDVDSVYANTDDDDDESEDADFDGDIMPKGISLNDRRLMERMKVLIEQDRVYQLNDLTAETFANMMGVSRKKLYLFLKEHMNDTFSGYINGCRLDYAATLLADPEYSNVSIVEISEMAGYNTLNTFSKVFKKRFNTTPAKYRLSQ